MKSKSEGPAKNQISRRRVMSYLGAGAAVTVFAPNIVRAQSKPSQLVVATGGGKLDSAYKGSVFKAFTEKTGINIVTTANPAAKLKAMVEQKAVEWDLMQGPAEGLIVHGRNGLLEPVDYKVVSKAGLIDGAAHDHFVLTDVAAYNIAWNTKNVKGAGPQSWKDVWAYNGRIGLWKRPFQTLEVALLADGVPLDKLYPLDIDRALKSLDKIKSKLAWWERGAQGGQVFIDGEVDVGAIWNGRVHQPKLDGAAVDFHFNQAIYVNDAWGIPKGAKNAKWAMELMALNLTPPVQASYSKLIPYGPVNRDALKLLDAKTLATLPSSAENFPKGRLLDLTYWADNSTSVVDRFNKWLLS